MTLRFMGALVGVVLLAGCQTNGFDFSQKAPRDDAPVYQSIPQDKINSDQRRIAAAGVDFLDKQDFEKASVSFNMALKLDIENSYLQFLNALSYHLRALKGDVSLFPLAHKGYELAIQFDPSNWIAHYHLGLLYLDQRKFALAQEKFSEATLFINDDPDILYSLAVASYYARDPVTAAGALDRARLLDPQNENVLKASSLIMAALGQSGKALEYQNNYIKAAVISPMGASSTTQLTRRLMDWKRFHARNGDILLAQNIEAVPVIAVESAPLPSVVEATAKGKVARQKTATADKAKATLQAVKDKVAADNNAAQAALKFVRDKTAAANNVAKSALKVAQAELTAATQSGQDAVKAALAKSDAAGKAADSAVQAADKVASEDVADDVIEAAEALVETTATAADEAADAIDAIEEAAVTAEEKALEAYEAAEEVALSVEEDGAAAIETAEEIAAAVEEETAGVVEAAEEVAAEAIENAEAASDEAAEAAELAAEDMATADEAAKEVAETQAEAAAQRAESALEVASQAAEAATESAEAAVEIGEDEAAAAKEVTAAQNSALEAVAALDAATAASKTATDKAAQAASAETASAARAAAAAANAASGETVVAANNAVAAAKKTQERTAAAKKVVADIAFFKDPETDEDDEEPVADDHKMVIVDVVIIRTEEDNTTSKGINLLNTLTLQFGGGLATSAAYGVSDINVLSSDSPGVSRTITRAINIPSITYSLNIANAATERNEILARPTLVALNGEQSEFFSGININASAVGGGDSGATISIDQEIGVKLKVTPDFLDDGRVKLAVEAERTFLASPNNTSITYTLRIDTSKTNVTANVAMNFGETLILSGMSEKETERVSSGVPFLQDIPGLQYLFSNRTTRDFQKSVLILLTPRPPNYIHQSDEAKKESRKTMNKEERVLSELQARYSDWFKPYPNWASVFNHLQANSLYREFRTGDVSMEKWENQQGFKARLKKAMEFLYH